jgi:NADH dehydrogenase
MTMAINIQSVLIVDMTFSDRRPNRRKLALFPWKIIFSPRRGGGTNQARCRSASVSGGKGRMAGSNGADINVGGAVAPGRHVVIVGAGFGGLACAGALGGSEIEVTVVDRRNHNLFQPLLYQVATAALSPADIAEPIRKSLGRFRNIKVILAEVVGIDTVAGEVLLSHGPRIAYDHLVIATGSQYNYFGHDEWRELAPGLKTLREARQIRQRLLSAFEQAELIDDPVERRALLTSVIIGGGPTGVEMAGAISELGRFMIERDFRNLDRSELRVVLVEAGERILAAFPESLSTYASSYLRNVGIEIRTDSRVTSVADGEVTIAGETMRAGTIVWGAGVKPSAAAQWLGLADKANGRIPVNADFSITGFPHIYALGDTTLMRNDDGKPLPALAQVAKQQGQHLGKALKQNILHGEPIFAFRFHNRGNTAVIGRHAAIFDFGRWTMKGRLAWFLWAFIHVYLLISFEKRLLVSLQWVWRYITRQRGARIIDERENPQ